MVAIGTERPRAGDLCAFISSGRQGVNYSRNTWHHALIALEQETDFLVVDRGGPGDNCEEVGIDDAVVYVAMP